MADRSFLTQEYARQCVDYDAGTGKFVWRERPLSHFAKEWRWKTWNLEHAGKPCFTALHTTGYPMGYIKSVRFLAHQLAWVWSHGVWPQGEIDHINGDRTDNRLANLRDVTSTENKRNVKRTSANRSGHVGVQWDKFGKRWRATINSGGKQIRLGSFDCLADAVVARKKAEEDFGYHPNHGRFG